jgi:hypothetical protein
MIRHLSHGRTCDGLGPWERGQPDCDCRTGRNESRWEKSEQSGARGKSVYCSDGGVP